MKKRVFEFNGAHGLGRTLANVLEHYAQAAYPVGGSDCAAASREALQELAAKIKKEEIVNINSRQRPLLKSALKWFYAEQPDVLNQDVYGRLLAQLQR